MVHFSANLNVGAKKKKAHEKYTHICAYVCKLNQTVENDVRRLHSNTKIHIYVLIENVLFKIPVSITYL